MNKSQGLIRKYNVTRRDGKPVGWCFVLEDKDPLAGPALRAYADAARAEGFVALADDLSVIAGFVGAGGGSGHVVYSPEEMK